jgi:hypothetical protein
VSALESLKMSRRFRNVGRGGGQGSAFVRSFFLVVLAGLTLLPPRRAGAADDVPPEQQVLILSRALVYDDNFKDRVGSEVRVAVLSKPGNAASDASAAAMLKAWKGVGNLKLAGLPLRVSLLAFKDAATFGPVLAAEGIDVLYICPGLEANLAEIIDLTRKRRVVTVGSREELVKKGASLGVFLVNGRPTIMVNLPASKTEGASFSSDLLRLATVIK